jgi:hypothetical protein
MNSEKGGGVSIKRNMAWGIGTLLVVVELYTLYKIGIRNSEDALSHLESLGKFYAVLDSAFILLVLSVTSVEKLSLFAKSITGGIINIAQTTETKKTESDEKIQ